MKREGALLRSAKHVLSFLINRIFTLAMNCRSKKSFIFEDCLSLECRLQFEKKKSNGGGVGGGRGMGWEKAKSGVER